MTGTRLGPYEIVALIGAGGMGEVYRARDTRLGREVAVKVLPADLAADPERLRRFEQEARATAALNHPNILSIHDIGTHEGQPYLVEELLKGESLRERLRAGALPVAKAVDLAVQVASGLAAAHASGIVHRDLKPENLFVTSDGHVKILDFGIARLVCPEALLARETEAVTRTGGTRAGVVLGTAGYMPPEQVRGLPCDHRADIFALGCVLYEMLSGQRAFAGATPADTMTAVLSRDPPSLAGTGQGVSPALQGVVRRCLEKRPDDRFSSAHDLALALELVSDAERVAAPAPAATGRAAGAGWLRRHKVLVSGLATALAIGVVATVVWLLKGHLVPPTSEVDRNRVVVAVFENRTGDTSLDTLGVMAADVLTQGLSRTGTISVALNPSVGLGAGTLPRAAAAPGAANRVEALAREAHAALVVAGAYYLEGQTVRFEPRLVRADGSLLAGLEPVTGTREAPSKLVEALGQRVLGAVASTSGRTVDPSVMRVPSWEAYREFERGAELFGTDMPETVRRLEAVVQIEPSWYFPRYLLFLALTWQSRWAEAAQQVNAAAQHEAELTPFERLMLRSTREQLAGHYEQVLATTQEMERQTPDLPWVILNAGAYGLLTNRPRYTIQQESRLTAHVLAGNSEMVHWPLKMIAWSHHNLGEYQVELEAARRGRKEFPTAFTFRIVELGALAALGRLEELDRLAEEAVAGQPPGGVPGELRGVPGEVLGIVALELRAHGHREASLRLANRAVETMKALPQQDASKPTIRKLLVSELCAAERWREAQEVADELAKQNPDDLGAMGLLGALAARLGDRTTALAISERLSHLDRQYLFGEHTYKRARIAAQLGDKDAAVALLRQAVSEGLDTWRGLTLELHTVIDLEPLRGYPPYEELMKPRG